MSAMRMVLGLVLLALVAAPGAAAPRAPIAPQLADPATADRIADAMQAMSRAFLNLRVGELEAALDGRPATPADRSRTLRDEHPGLDRDVQRQVAQARPMIRNGMRAMNDALPQVIDSLDQARKSVERAMANMPDPSYPAR